jgi:transaldolase
MAGHEEFALSAEAAKLERDLILEEISKDPSVGWAVISILRVQNDHLDRLAEIKDEPTRRISTASHARFEQDNSEYVQEANELRRKAYLALVGRSASALTE